MDHLPEPASGSHPGADYESGGCHCLPRQYTFLNYLRCHDDIGWGLDYAYLRQFGVEEVAHKRFLSDYFQGNVDYDRAKSNFETAIKERYPDITEIQWAE